MNPWDENAAKVLEIGRVWLGRELREDERQQLLDWARSAHLGPQPQTPALSQPPPGGMLAQAEAVIAQGQRDAQAAITNSLRAARQIENTRTGGGPLPADQEAHLTQEMLNAVKQAAELEFTSSRAAQPSARQQSRRTLDHILEELTTLIVTEVEMKVAAQIRDAANVAEGHIEKIAHRQAEKLEKFIKTMRDDIQKDVSAAIEQAVTKKIGK